MWALWTSFSRTKIYIYSAGPFAFLSPPFTWRQHTSYILLPSCSELLVFQWADNIYFAETYTLFLLSLFFTLSFREWIFPQHNGRKKVWSVCCFCGFCSQSHSDLARVIWWKFWLHGGRSTIEKLHLNGVSLVKPALLAHLHIIYDPPFLPHKFWNSNWIPCAQIQSFPLLEKK